MRNTCANIFSFTTQTVVIIPKIPDEVKPSTALVCPKHCAAVVCPALESANVVGYLDYNLAYGYNFFAPVFEKTDGSDVRLSDISLADAGDGESTIQIVTTAGALGSLYSWTSPDVTGEAEWCWFDMVNWAPVDFALTDGQSFYLYAATASAKAKVAGQVRNDVFNVPLAYGYNCVGNSTPIDVDIQDMALSNAGDGESNIQVVTTAGGLGAVYSWTSPDVTGEAEWCWFDMVNWAPVADVTYLAGEGFYLYCATANGTLVLPSAL